MNAAANNTPLPADNSQRSSILIGEVPVTSTLHNSNSFDSLLSEDILASPIFNTQPFTVLHGCDRSLPLTGPHLLLQSAHMCSSPPTNTTNDVSIDISSDLTPRRARETQEQTTEPNVVTAPLTNENDAQKLQTKAWSDSSSIVPITGLLVSLLFPPAGCIIFCWSLGAPDDSPRYRWSIRALYLGSFLSFIYSLLITMLVSEFYLATADKDLLYGTSYSKG